METEMFFCRKCQKYRGFYKKDDIWICCGCKKELKENNKPK